MRFRAWLRVFSFDQSEVSVMPVAESAEMNLRSATSAKTKSCCVISSLDKSRPQRRNRSAVVSGSKFVGRRNSTLVMEASRAVVRGDRVAVQNGTGTMRLQVSKILNGSA